MTLIQKPQPGTIRWFDLTVEHADQISKFYEAVVGWKSTPVSMGEYNDFNMQSSPNETVTGICHKQGKNINIPSQWLMYIVVEDLSASIEACKKNGGTLIQDIIDIGEDGSYCIIQDPSGAVCALYQSAPDQFPERFIIQ